MYKKLADGLRGDLRVAWHRTTDVRAEPKSDAMVAIANLVPFHTSVSTHPDVPGLGRFSIIHQVRAVRGWNCQGGRISELSHNRHEHQPRCKGALFRDCKCFLLSSDEFREELEC